MSKNILLSAARKLSNAGHLVGDSNWPLLRQKLRRNFDSATAPYRESTTLCRDAITNSHWRWRKRTQRLPFDFSTPFSAGSQSAPEEQPKNVIWIMLDALRQDVFHEYLARGGFHDLVGNSVYFPRAFAQGSWTYPSVFSFLTGRYPFNCGVSTIVRENGETYSACGDFDDSAPTIFSILRAHGYQVGSILDGWGFTVRNTAGQVHREDRYFEENWGWLYGQQRRYLSLTELRDASTSYIRRAAKQAPFFLFVRSLYTHAPYRGIFANPEYVDLLSRRNWQFRIIEGFIRGMAAFEKVYLRTLLKALTQTGHIDDTIIVICSDHGEMFWNLEDDLRNGSTTDKQISAKEMWRHQLEPYNALTKVPLLIWGTDMRGIYPDRFRLVDIVPTLLGELSVTHDPSVFDGISIHRTAPRPLYADSAGYGFGGLAFQTGGEKLMLSRRLGTTSYAIGADEYERLSLRRDAVGELDELNRFLYRAHRSSGSTPEHDAEESLQKRLRALGYADDSGSSVETETCCPCSN